MLTGMLRPSDGEDDCQWRHELPGSNVTMEADKENAEPEGEHGGSEIYSLAELLQSVDGMEQYALFA